MARHNIRSGLAWACGLLVAGIATTAIVGYLIRDAGCYQWCDTPMAINTALALLGLGVGLALAAHRE